MVDDKCIDAQLFLINRFDIYGLSPDADEDESGIKRASENSRSNNVQICLVLQRRHTKEVTGLTHKLNCIYFCFISTQLKPW